jgi:hypothetical protein
MPAVLKIRINRGSFGNGFATGGKNLLKTLKRVTVINWMKRFHIIS